MKKNLKLYIFENFCRDWTPGLAFAIAENEGDAKKQIEAKMGWDPWDWGKVTVKPLSKRTAFYVTGGG